MYTEDMMQDEFALKLTGLRKERGWTQEDLADKCGISRQAVAKWEGGKSLPDIFRIVELADLFEVDIAEILPNTESNINLKYCMEAMGEIFPAIVVANVTRNIAKYITGHTIAESTDFFNGTYEDIYERGAQNIPNAAERIEFLKTFKKENLIKVAAEGGKIIPLTHRTKDNNGELHWVLNTACFVKDQNSRDVIVVFLMRLIDDYKKKESEDEKAIRERQEIINSLFVQLSHDVRTPLNSIMGFLNLAQTTDDPEQKDYYLRMAVDSSNTMTNVLNEIIAMADDGTEKEAFKKDDSAFKKFFQRVTGREEIVRERERVKANAFKGKRILLAEDTEANAMVTESFVREWGGELIRVKDGKEAVDLVKKDPLKEFDLILMDVQMPNMDGYKATRAIRKLANKRVAKVPIIALTANAFEEDRIEAEEAGMNSHLCKPFTPQQLFDKMSEFI